MEGIDEDVVGGQLWEGDELRRQQAHLNFSASHQARHATRQHTSGGEGGVGDHDEDKPKEESAIRFNESLTAETQEIAKALASLVAERKQQTSHTAAGTGLSVARHAHGEAKAVERQSDGTSTATVDGRVDVREKLDALVDRVKGLRKRTVEATLFLTVYDLRRAQEELGKLWASVESTRAELVPRKKFAFRIKSKASGGRLRDRVSESGVNLTTRERQTKESVLAIPTGEETRENRPGLSSLTGQEVDVLAQDADKDKDFNVTDLDQCKVTILHMLGALRLRRLTSCRVVCGPVQGPIYVEGCKDCVIIAAGRQLRIHDSQDVHFYVLVASGPIIEDCGGLRFAPIAPTGLQYPDYHRHLQAAGLDEVAVTNAWEDVKDFKWHRAHKSPNWDTIPETDRESDYLAMAAPKLK